MIQVTLLCIVLMYMLHFNPITAPVVFAYKPFHGNKSYLFTYCTCIDVTCQHLKEKNYVLNIIPGHRGKQSGWTSQLIMVT